MKTQVFGIPASAFIAISIFPLSSLGEASDPKQFMVLDVSSGSDETRFPVSFLSEPPSGGWKDIHKTTQIVLKKVPAGTFRMGSDKAEIGRKDNEDLHSVSITQPFYIGVFEITVAQWESVTDQSASSLETRKPENRKAPVTNVSYGLIRGMDSGATWPLSNAVDDDSFLGIIRSKTGLEFDLPTEAQWEYACRAGTETSLNNGSNIVGRAAGGPDSAVAVTCFRRDPGNTWRFWCQPSEVGRLRPNAWGLHDMHGNAMEWCLDWYSDHLGTGARTDPKGPIRKQPAPEELKYGATRVLRGGCCHDTPDHVRSANRDHDIPVAPYDGAFAVYGFRIACPVPATHP